MKLILYLTGLILLVVAACTQHADHPILVKTRGNPGYGNVQCILQDHNGNLWFGTTENGLYKYDGKTFHQFLVQDGLPSNNVYSLLEDRDGTFWIGTTAGLCSYTENTFTHIQIPLPRNLPSNTNNHYRNSHWIYSMKLSKDGRVWFATIDGVYTYDGKSFIPFPMNEAANGFLTHNDKTERLLEDKDGNIWFGGRTNHGVFRYDGNSITNLKLEELIQAGPRPKPHDWAWPQLQDRNGNIWFSNWGGAYRYDGKSFTSFPIPGGVTCIFEDSRGNIWFGGDGGLRRYDGKAFVHFSVKDGLSTPWVWSISEDATGNIWVGTRHTGLYLFDGKTFINYAQNQQHPAAEQ